MSRTSKDATAAGPSGVRVVPQGERPARPSEATQERFQAAASFGGRGRETPPTASPAQQEGEVK
jgi:hypothetical protein